MFNKGKLMENEKQTLFTIDDKINMILDSWYQDGMEVVEGTGGVPVHPELVYRLSGEWQGWNHFLEILPETDPIEYENNKERDHMEKLAFLKYQSPN